MNPIVLYALVTTESAASGTGQRAYLYAHEQAAIAEGKRLKAGKPAEVASFEFVVLPLEGPSQ